MSQDARTVRSLLDYGVELFEEAGVSFGHGTDNALDEAAWLVMHALGLPLADLDACADLPLNGEQYHAARELLDRRVASRKPAAYLIHEAWLGPHRFYVDERVIVPRSFIADILYDRRVPGRRSAILDLCTGSGCLAILAVLAFPKARVDASDISEDALDVARHNIADYGLGARIRLVKGDLFAGLRGRRYDLIVTNPPYVKASSMRTLPEEYRREPAMALASGEDGLQHARAILAGAREHLKPRGLLVMEIGHNRKALEKAFPKLPFEWPATRGGEGYVIALARESLPG